ncbi:MAG: hypothetical protein WCJ92_02080 [Alphaproteobacteria bacterium]
MKVLKGLVLTMLVSTATIFAMDASVDGDSLTTDGLTTGQTGVKTIGLGTVGDSLVISADGGVVHDHGVAGSIILADTVDHTSVIALSSTEVAAISLTRLMTEGSVDEKTSSVLSTVLSTLGKGTKGTIDAITALTGLTSGSELISVGVLNTVQSVLGVLTSEIAGVHTWKQTPTGILTAYDIGSDVSADSEGSTVFSLTVNEVVKIEASRSITDLATILNIFNPFTLSATTEQLTSVIDSVAGTYDAFSSLVGSATSGLVDSDDDTGTHGGTVDDVSSSVMGLGIGTSGLQRQSTVAGGVNEESNVDEGDLS